MKKSTTWLLTLVSAGWLAGCATDVTMENPRTGQAVVCRESLLGLDPWSQKEACVGDLIARGWTRAERN